MNQKASFPIRGRHLLAAGAALTLLAILLIPTADLQATPETEGAVAPDETVALHLSLRATVPAADSTVNESPSEVRLIFSEPPQMDGTRVRLLDAAEELVATSEAAADADDAREVYIVPEASLSDGTYTVVWRTIAQDGHAQNGDFQFTVQTGQ